MSGVEIAGLILGAMPLFITALEDYNEGLDPVKAFLRWERELPQFIRKLRNQHVHFQQTLRLLLEPITTELELAEMLTDPGGKPWKDEQLAGKLQDRLQESFQAYQSTIADIERIMKKIANKLDLERAAHLTRNDLEAMLIANPQKNNRFEFKKRVRFGMSKKTIKGLLEELDECNKELERFTDRSERLEAYKKPSKPSFAVKLHRIQGYAKHLHQALLSSWTCSCASSHCTDLQLEQRVSLYSSSSKRNGESTGGTHFTVAFSSTCTRWTRQEAEIRIEEESTETKDPPGVSPRKPKFSKTVSFSKPPPPYSLHPDPATPMPTLQEINDICSAIHQLHDHSPCIGFILDYHSSKLKGIDKVVSRVEKPLPTHEIVTLDELMTRPPMVKGKASKLSRKERYSLAVTLASSTLQLYSTPWFPDQWSKKNIIFRRTISGPRGCDIDHPYVTSTVPEVHTPSEEKVPGKRGIQNKNTVLLALAIALLELYFGVSAEESFGDGPSDVWKMLSMVYEWAKDEEENLSAAFLSAVNHCLRCFGDPGASLQDVESLQAAVEGIVLPLQDELCQFLGKPPG